MRAHSSTVLGFTAVLIAVTATPALALPAFGAFAGTTYGLQQGGAGHSSASSSSVSSGLGGGYVGGAQASLGSGTLKASSAATYNDSCIPNPPFRDCAKFGMTSRAAMWDTVHFGSVGGARENISLIPTRIGIDGNLAGQNASAWVRSYVGFNSDIDVDTLQWVQLTESVTEVLDNLIVPLTDTPLFVYVELRTEALAHAGAPFSLADFGNTLHFEWQLPDDLVATSASGVFLTAVDADVPEPAAASLLGLGLLGLVARRRNATAAAA